MTQETADSAALLPTLEGIEQRYGEMPRRVSADSGIFALDPLRELEKQKVDAYVLDPYLAHVLNRGGRLRGRARDPVHQPMRRKLRSALGRAIYPQRKAMIEPIFGVLKGQRGMRSFRLRGLNQLKIELALATTAYNLTRMWHRAPNWNPAS